jgi:hypothetical protein
MADSEVQICNIALARVQGEPITDLVSDTTKSASLCRTFYEPTRDALLEERPWAFAIQRQVLSVVTGVNLTSKTYIYQLPEEPYCLRPLVLLGPISNFLLMSDTEGESGLWEDPFGSGSYLELIGYVFKREGRTLITNLAVAGLKYVARITDPTQFPPTFVDALGWLLASNLAKPINGEFDPGLLQMYQASVLAAFGADSQGAQEPRLKDEGWVQGRFGNPRGRL